MEVLKAAIATGSFRRLVVGFSTGAVVVANKKLELGLDPTEIGELVLLAITYLVASNTAEVKKAGIEARAAVNTDKQAADVLKSVAGAESPAAAAEAVKDATK